MNTSKEIADRVGVAEPMPKATVGRIVHFYSATVGAMNSGQGYNGRGAGPYAAIVVDDHGDQYISLTVFPPFAPPPYAEGSVRHKSSGDPRYWEFPPRE